MGHSDRSLVSRARPIPVPAGRASHADIQYVMCPAGPGPKIRRALHSPGTAACRLPALPRRLGAASLSSEAKRQEVLDRRVNEIVDFTMGEFLSVKTSHIVMDVDDPKDSLSMRIIDDAANAKVHRQGVLALAKLHVPSRQVTAVQLPADIAAAVRRATAHADDALACLAQAPTEPLAVTMPAA